MVGFDSGVLSMRICFIIDSFRFGGAQKVTYDLVKSLRDNDNIKVDVVTYFDKIEILDAKALEIKNVTICGLSRASVLSYLDALMFKTFGKLYQYLMSSFYTRSLMRQLDINSYDKILLVSDAAFFPFHRLKHYHNKITFITHSIKSKQYLKSNFFLVKFLLKTLVKKVFSNVHLVAVSEGIRADIITNFGVNESKVNTIYNLLPFKDIKTKAQLAPEISVSQEYICHVGRHSSEKRIDILLLAYKRLVDNGFTESLLLIGDGPERIKLESMVKSLGLSNKVTFCGFLSNPYPLVSKSKCLVLSSEREGLPTVIIEALCLGVPVVSTNCESGPSEIMQGKLAEYLTRVNCSDDLANKISSVLLGNYPEVKVPNVFSSDTIILSWIDYLND
ncbi:glycosyltransferase [Vibrio alginolyticus]|uniref:glycosyltransferase n=1 Tax=Vibrio alginolyticus TaxID=663 RepID=UPI002160DB51|nr:glycosyltransferase [Vibrio alginolyticus]EJN3800925.1 glycosyltransferase [Vibrio alginolyticus]MCS0209196.1 glycosyltransferase [Vibrio alginolyticus]